MMLFGLGSWMLARQHQKRRLYLVARPAEVFRDRPLQAKLLRVLQEGEFERLGSAQTQRVNVRLVAATNRDLADMVSKKQFRSDLYYRLNVFPIAVPLLRDRLADIPLLVEHFVKTFSEQMGKQIRGSHRTNGGSCQPFLARKYP
jgi:transcriptional regulator with PAS, ATPase and Fis domain